MLKLRLIRHPKPQVEAGICYGATDLHAEPDALAAQLQSCLVMPKPVLVLSSPLKRCAVLAHALAEHGWPAPLIDPGLAEMNFGDWEMQPWKHIERAQINAWAADIASYAPPGGESVQQVAQRALAAIHAALQSHAQKAGPWTADHHESGAPRVFVICHSGVMQGLNHALSDKPWKDFKPVNFAYGEACDVALPVPAKAHLAGR